MKLLHGHTSPETAYVVDDYPYGFRLRCKIRYWIEHKPGKGMRCVSQTTNPKISGREVWNAPKASTYSDWRCLYLDHEDHVQNWAISLYSPMTWFNFYGNGLYHQLAGEERLKVDRMVTHMERYSTDTFKRRDEIAAALSRLQPAAELSSDAVRALVEADTKSRYYESDFNVFLKCWRYEAARTFHHEQTECGVGP